MNTLAYIKSKGVEDADAAFALIQWVDLQWKRLKYGFEKDDPSDSSIDEKFSDLEFRALIRKYAADHDVSAADVTRLLSD